MENNRLEYKRKLNDDLEKEVVAFLNHEGGILYIGIEDNGDIFGVENTDNLILQIKDRLKNKILPSCLGLFDILSEEKETKSVIKIIIAGGIEKPYYIRKQGMSERGCFIRVGTSAEPMSARMIENLFSRRTKHSISKIKSTYQDLRFEQLKIYYEAQDLSLNQHFAKNLALLTEDGFYNYVAYLLADNNSNSVKVAKYSGKNRVNLIENNEYGFCSLIKSVKQVWDKINLENYTHSQITSIERIDQRLWDVVALREAVINAFVHTDFTREVMPKFEIFEDRIEITSAGGLPANLSQEEFFLGYSIPRNKELMRIFKDLKLVEQLGTGVPRILAAYDKSCFHFSENFLRMVFPKKSFENISTQKQKNEEAYNANTNNPTQFSEWSVSGFSGFRGV
ncbi:MAG: putative DNA binding domain-containing protein, partial [Bernardetiaceae bacterium]|nr:putative DNA binding domain-containing protein [Bernardetiaceae bacterium]